MVNNLKPTNKIDQKGTVDNSIIQTTNGVSKQVLKTVNKEPDIILDDLVTFIMSFKRYITIDKDTGKVNLSILIYEKLQPLLKDKINYYLKHPNFTEVIVNELGLIGKYKLFIDEKKRKIELINITDDRRFNGIKAHDVNELILSILEISSEQEMESFLKKVVYNIKLPINKYIGESFKTDIKNFLYEEIYKESKKINTHVNPEYLKAIAGKIYRDNFTYINKTLGHKVLSETSEIILSELLKGDSLYIINNINKALKDLIESIEEKQTSNIENKYIDFSKTIKVLEDRINLYFDKMYKIEIDKQLIKGIIEYLVSNNNLGIEGLDKLIGYTIKSIEKDSNDSSIINTFIKGDIRITVLDKKSDKYDNKIAMEYIRKITIETKRIYNLHKDKSKQLEITKFQEYHYSGTMNKIKSNIANLEKELETASKQLQEIDINISNCKDKKQIIELNKDRDLQLKKVVKIMNDLDKEIINSGLTYKKLNSQEALLEDEINELRFRYNNIKNIYDSITKDLLHIILFGKKI